MGYWRPKPNCFYLISETKKRSAYLQTGGKYVVCVSVGLCFPICMGRDDSKKRERDREREGGYYNATRQGQGMRRLTTVCNNPYSHTPDQGWRGGANRESEAIAMQWGKDMVWDDQLLSATTHIQGRICVGHTSARTSGSGGGAS